MYNSSEAKLLSSCGAVEADKLYVSKIQLWGQVQGRVLSRGRREGGRRGRLPGELRREHLGALMETSLGELLNGWAGPSC